MTAAPVLHREVFATPRAAEFFELRALQAQTGQPAYRFAEVLLKELVDNALDAAEAAGVEPEVTIGLTRTVEALTISVGDNGPGMPPDLIKRVLDFAVLVSDKAAYRSPTRGMQGNALKTVLGIPPALGSDQPVLIHACGIRHAITASIDPAGALRIDHQQLPTPTRTGTTITVTIPVDQISQQFDAPRWARAFALSNPHATVSYQANGGDHGEAVSYKPTAPEGWRKPLPTDPTSPHYYDEPALKRLVFAHVNAARTGGTDLPLGKFVRSFAGLTATAKAKQVCATLPTITRLSDFEADPEMVGTLLAVMQGLTRPPKPSVLGRVDEAHYRACFDAWYGVRRLWFKRAQTSDGAIPWIVEIAVAETEQPGELFYAVNYSPSFGDPLARLPLDAGELRTVGAASFLRQADAYPDGTSNRAAAIHLITPAPQFLDKGKTALVVPDGRR